MQYYGMWSGNKTNTREKSKEILANLCGPGQIATKLLLNSSFSMFKLFKVIKK